MRSPDQLRLVATAQSPSPTSADIAAAFDAARLTQARRLAGLTKTALAAGAGVTPAAVGQWEANTNPPRPDHLARIAELLDVPVAFFAAGRPYAQLDGSTVHFRSLRSTRSSQRATAVSFGEQLWELTYALEKRVQLPSVDLPGFAGGEVHDGSADPVEAARHLRAHWELGAGPIRHVVRTMENRGLVVALAPFAGTSTARIDACSTSRMPRPLVLLDPSRANDVYRHRFTAAHELGHLLLHSADPVPGDLGQERQADSFAAELLTPHESIAPQLPTRFDLAALNRLSEMWGVSVKSLVYRCRELGLLSDASARRAYQRLNKLTDLKLIEPRPVTDYPGETPSLLRKAFALAEESGLTITQLAEELRWMPSRVRLLLGDDDPRPSLRLV